MFWKLFYQLKGVKGLNEAIDNRNIKDKENFLKVYLDRLFDSSDEFKIFDFLSYFDIAEKDYEFYESLMIGSKYFESMPLDKAVEALDDFARLTNWVYDFENFCRYLISKVTDSKIFLNYPVRTIAHLYECYSDLGIEDKIIDLGKDYIIDLSKHLDFVDSHKLLFCCKEYLSIEELKQVSINGDFSVEDIFKLSLQSYGNDELDLLFEIIINKKEVINPVIDIKRKRKISVFEQFLDALKRNEKITEDHKNYLANKLIESKDYFKMLDWLANIECEDNYKVIDALIGNAVGFTILQAVSDKYICYTLKKLLEFGDIDVNALFIEDYDLEKTNLILDSLYSLKEDVKFSKRMVLKLLKKGVDKFPVIINQCELSEKERLEVLSSLKEINSDWLIIYGKYLVTGNYYAKTAEETAEEQLIKIRSLESKGKNVKLK